MAKFERYDARDDARFFDGGEIEDEDEEGSRLPLLLVIGLLVVAAFAGVVWLAYTQGVQRGRADAPRMLVAAAGPVKEAPANPGGSQTPYTGLKIYQQPVPAGDEDIESAPQPPTPKVSAPAKPAAAPQKAAAARVKPAPIKAAAAAPMKAAPVKAAPPARVKVAAATPSSPVLGGPPLIETLQAAPAVAIPPHVQHAASSIPALKPSTAAARADTPAKQTVASLPPNQSMVIAPAPVQTAGAVALQIGAYKSEAEANAAWQAFSRRHPMATAYQSEVRMVDLGGKGVWYRLRLGSFVDKTEATAFCDKLKADGGTCFLAK